MDGRWGQRVTQELLSGTGGEKNELAVGHTEYMCDSHVK